MRKSEDLIRAVQKLRSIWDVESPDYHNKSMKEEAWTTIARILIDNWETLNKSEKFINKSELKKKWSNMRDYYKKLLAEQRSGNISKRKKKYVFADAMHFLKPVYDKGNEDDGESNHLEKPPDETCPNFKFPSFDSEEEEMVLQLDSDEEHQEPTKETITFVSCPNEHNLYIASGSKPPSKKAKLKETSSSQIQREKTGQEDADFCFLKSLLPDIKRLTDKQKFEFKLGVMELYKKISDCSDRNRTFITKQEVGSTQESEEDEN